MARYAKEHKQVTRQRIIEKAGQRFKQDGIDGSGISTLMSDAGLTNGAFYAHFESKEDLLAAVIADQLRAQAASFGTLRPGREGLEDLIREYLSPEHRDHPGAGCPSAALLDEIGRCKDGVKRAYADGATAILEEFSARLAPEDPRSAHGKAIGLFTVMVGTLQLSRALTDRKRADEVLERGIENALTFMTREQETTLSRTGLAPRPGS
ncbi:TetR/AcrR family transcriptional regulator [Streptomyces turgidiscabies]|uniref:Transcriptional regulator, TetR family n=1 Tax=Streptomyces turgidiscabies (strain Car8) TaxID=698760 RepID=L7FHN5_STRT8|nr:MULTISPECIES: TetR family transcriptional regulator [Streptomyces]ELP70566.1 transcriptional regulator, TetR family [Streptomyces turgidiscabies Car8]MDX3496165.1 TetR family transcriptional regulator [Streptomyces turgidiscabies]GAQ75340.1 HTH-type transcriptional regulator AcrR [Streptomyces turgidiscabies]